MQKEIKCPKCGKGPRAHRYTTIIPSSQGAKPLQVKQLKREGDVCKLSKRRLKTLITIVPA